ncbi:diacylglycerol kinase [Aureimonas flava]|uniref:Diacylglycerol kinase n=1 Tax=Aureimonas flava TaxID=2320271 RepID=A0A3A1WH39_9HYPH|nr:diacylglycerol kinase [Aureimonas flava]RIX97995.1 diacylglycerol kinase [Aureimonas flava]
MSVEAPHPPLAPAKLRGLAHVFAATRYSLAGLARLASEAAFRHEIALGAVLLGTLAATGASRVDLLIQCGLLLLLAAAEALNTAIELIVDLVSPEVSVLAGQAKDLGSFAVSCVILANLGFAVACIAAIV